MSFYKGLEYLVYLESLRVMHSNNSALHTLLVSLKFRKNKTNNKTQMLLKGGGGFATPSTPPLDPPLGLY